MIGLGFFLALILYIGLALLISYWARRGFDTPKAKHIAQALTLIIFALIPTWDIIPGKLYFNHLCETEGGLKIYKTAEEVEGLHQVEGGSSTAQSTLRYGYKFVEGTSLEGNLMKYTLGANGALLQQKISEVTSNYIVSRTIEPRSFNILKTSYRIAHRQTGEQYSMMSFFSHSGNWLQVKFSPLLGHGGDCTSPPPSFKDFYLKTIKPKN